MQDVSLARGLALVQLPDGLTASAMAAVKLPGHAMSTDSADCRLFKLARTEPVRL